MITAMPQYAAVLGHQPHISFAELACSVPGFEKKRLVGKDILVFESTEPLNADSLRTLGGSIIIAEKITDADLSIDDLPKLLAKELEDVRGKVVFGIRAYSIQPAYIKNVYRKGKDAVKRLGKNCRYVGNEHKPALPVLLHDSGLITGKHGIELFLIGGENGLWIGKTIAAQDVDSYTKRDMNKPVRDTTVGLLPPKLAQVMLNFGGWLAAESKPKEELPRSAKTDSGQAPKKKKKQVFTVLDPFCGTGVIPMEALLRGWPILASDVSLKAVNGTSKNIEWIRKEEKILKKDVSDKVWKQDATKPFDLKELPDVIVTETSLGENLMNRPSVKDATRHKNENEKLQDAFLANAAKTFPGVPIVCSWPMWQSKTDAVKLEKVWAALDKHGYRAVLPPGVEESEPGRLSLLYRRKDQFVGREIVFLKPKKN